MNRKLLISVAGISAFCLAFGLTACGSETGNVENGGTGIGTAPFLSAPLRRSGSLPRLSVSKGGAFGYCNSLTELKVPDNVTFFQGVGGNAVLKSVTFGKNSKLKEIGKATFGYCPELTDVNLPDSVRIIEDDTFEESKIYTDKSFWTDGILYVGNHMIATDETVSGKITVREGTKCIALDAFRNCTDVTEVKLKNGQLPKTAAEINVN